ncbi:MAG: thiosulfate sulfurtransferase GlpE [Oceanobacter sp.]
MASFTRISIAQAKPLITEQKAAVADIRDAMSYQAAHITGAERIDNANLSEFMAKQEKSAPLVICCYHGNSSQQAAQFFADQGYTEVYSLDGGFEMWKTACPELCES